MELSDKGGIGLRVKVTRDDDMINRVCAVKAALGTKSPLSIFDDDLFLITCQGLLPATPLPTDVNAMEL